MPTEKSREDYERRRLAKLGLRLKKSPARSFLTDWYGPGYQILQGNVVIAGCSSREYQMTLEQVEEFKSD